MRGVGKKPPPHRRLSHSPELRRPFRGLRMWLPLQLFGVTPFRAALSETIWLARYFQERVQEIPGPRGRSRGNIDRIYRMNRMGFSSRY